MSVLLFLFCITSLSVFIPEIEYFSRLKQAGIAIGFGGLCLILTALLVEPLILNSLGA